MQDRKSPTLVYNSLYCLTTLLPISLHYFNHGASIWITVLSLSVIVWLVFKTYFVCMSALPACLKAHHMCTWFPWRSEEGMGILELELLMVMNDNVGSENQTWHSQVHSTYEASNQPFGWFLREHLHELPRLTLNSWFLFFLLSWLAPGSLYFLPSYLEFLKNDKTFVLFTISTLQTKYLILT